MTRLEFTRFCHKIPALYATSLRILAVHSCSIAFDGSVFILKDGVMIVYKISASVVPKNNEVKMILSGGAYSIEQFNKSMQEALKGKGDQWVPPQIKNYKLIIPKNHAFMALKTFLTLWE